MGWRGVDGIVNIQDADGRAAGSKSFHDRSEKWECFAMND
jgi:hypothetical protein